MAYINGHDTPGFNPQYADSLDNELEPLPGFGPVEILEPGQDVTKETKPGYLTTEFYVTLGMMILSLLGGIGIITGTQAADYQTHIGQFAAAAVAIATAGAVVWRYIAARQSAKT